VATAIGESREDDAKLAGSNLCPAPLEVKGAAQAHDPREASKAPLGHLEARARIDTTGQLGADDEQRAAANGDADGFRKDARDVDEDFEARGGLDNVERRPTVSAGRGDAWNIPVELSQEVPGVVCQVRRALLEDVFH